MNEHEHTTEILLEASNERLGAFDQLLNGCLPTLATRLWTTCCWSRSMSDGWKIGDFRFLILTTSPDNETQIYIRFWSEPQELVAEEVSSGEWAPGTLKYVGKRQRDFLKSLGFDVGGPASNFRKEVDISTAARAETVAREVLRILYEGFEYRGQWPIDLHLERGERAEQTYTHDAVTPEDFAKLAHAAGFHAAVQPPNGPAGVRFVILRRNRRSGVAILDGRVPDNDVYTLITLRAKLSEAVSDEVLQRLNARMHFLRIRRVEGGVATAEMPLSLLGGVTAHWMTLALNQWAADWKHAERILNGRRSVVQNKRRITLLKRVH
jgi:hypothetical protein